MTDKAKEWLNTGRARVTVYLSGSNLREGRQADDQVRTEKQVTAANLCFNSQSNSNQVLLSVLKSSGYWELVHDHSSLIAILSAGKM